MSYSKRSLNNPPDYYYNLTNKQKRNWRKTTRKIEKNEELRQRFPPFNSTANITVIYLHYKSTIETIDALIIKAKHTQRYTIDTESENNKRRNHSALIQIQFVHSIDDSTIMLIEVAYLPDPHSILFNRMKELCSIIFNNHNEIISWGPL
ncbi:unnamed protein product [Rotaria magnacalcarata]|uniref:Uncharacterized protein n=1 Tax=Rotaria magnacalcarata TaxID=392030 RepID=A0A815YK67_9BILA|nr:unnamed protein product [Rotaria magnacalcarata]CAF1571094.1 unnamed protein product [Rotaria magnacalcarata]CAF2195392.1 unnamed protein product [Rotaria magnacalcarata]CAF3837082.1 unnamed protein product [Rotaria magnacalcarata]CAF3867514.1 unnamed protein product [Rotaria magnacalcarata]